MANLYLLYLADFCRNITTTLTTPIVGVKRLTKTVVVLLRLLLGERSYQRDWCRASHTSIKTRPALGVSEHGFELNVGRGCRNPEHAQFPNGEKRPKDHLIAPRQLRVVAVLTALVLGRVRGPRD
jgi:hypothetical protein